jgi:hypothetical protein
MLSLRQSRLFTYWYSLMRWHVSSTANIASVLHSYTSARQVQYIRHWRSMVHLRRARQTQWQSIRTTMSNRQLKHIFDAWRERFITLKTNENGMRYALQKWSTRTVRTRSMRESATGKLARTFQLLNR